MTVLLPPAADKRVEPQDPIDAESPALPRPANPRLLPAIGSKPAVPKAPNTRTAPSGSPEDSFRGRNSHAARPGHPCPLSRPMREVPIPSGTAGDADPLRTLSNSRSSIHRSGSPGPERAAARPVFANVPDVPRVAAPERPRRSAPARHECPRPTANPECVDRVQTESRFVPSRNSPDGSRAIRPPYRAAPRTPCTPTTGARPTPSANAAPEGQGTDPARRQSVECLSTTVRRQLSPHAIHPRGFRSSKGARVRPARWARRRVRRRDDTATRRRPFATAPNQLALLQSIEKHSLTPRRPRTRNRESPRLPFSSRGVDRRPPTFQSRTIPLQSPRHFVDFIRSPVCSTGGIYFDPLPRKLNNPFRGFFSSVSDLASPL